MLVLEGLVGLHRTVSFFGNCHWGIDLDYCGIEWFALETNRNYSVVFEIASGPITPWQIDQETMETVTDFVFLGFKIIADGDCSHEIKRSLLLERKAITNLDSILKSRDITLQQRSV